MKNLLFIAILAVFIGFPSQSSANNYRYYTGNSAIYSRKTTAYSNTYNPIRRSGIPSLNSVNPYESRRVSLALQQEKYLRDLAIAEAKADSKYAKDRLVRQERERRADEQARQRLARNQQAIVAKAARNNKSKPNTTSQLLVDKKSLLDKKDLAVVKSSDFNMISESLEQNADYKYVPKKQEKVALVTTEQPSFFQRLRWALFGRN